MGGIPFYLSQIDEAYSLNENIDNIFFKEHGPLWDEFSRLYGTLFNNNSRYIKTIEILSKNRYGLTRKEIAQKTKSSNNGELSQILQNLIDSGFIMKTEQQAERKTEKYQLSDFYTIFYFSFLKENYAKDEHYWSNSIDLPKRRTWLGLTFELLCLKHIKEVKVALGISGILSTFYSYNRKATEENKECQIDLVIDRRDNVLSLCEIKFSINEYEIDKDYHMNLSDKLDALQKEYKRKSIQLVLITTYGLKKNIYSNIINKTITLDDLVND